ncbi:MAG: methyltransferase domain-containing protein, partial [Ktedonobacteraceae bacterium]|nr:methyltransferase domain-containing protein [Ktedonobacteraceae bacterium]
MQNVNPTQHQQQKQQIAAGFSRAAATYDQAGPPLFTYFGQRLVELARLPEHAHVLDVAAGRGAVLFPAAEQVGAGGSVVGIDLAENMVETTQEEIQRRQLAQASMYVMDAEHLTFPSASFDVVCCGFGLFFFPHLEHALRECARVLKPGGSIAISTWGTTDERWLWYGDLLKTAPLNWEAAPWFTYQTLNNADALRAALASAGFTQLAIVEEQREFVYASEEEWWAAQWSHGMRHLLETLLPSDLARFQSDAFHRLQAIKQPDGFPLLCRVL